MNELKFFWVDYYWMSKKSFWKEDLKENDKIGLCHKTDTV